MKNSLGKSWRLWAKAIGEKSGATDKEANIIAAIRSVFFILTVVTEISIIANFTLNHLL
jgi:hypothetical protein